MGRMPPLNRRQLVKGSAAAAGFSSLAPAVFARGLGRSDNLRAAVVGVRSRGGSHIDGLQKQAGVDVVALVDVDDQVAASKKEQLEKKKKDRGGDWEGAAVQTYRDIRKVLERDDIDLIAMATPNHVHALHTIWSCQAGKDVYVEKPVCHNIFEGRKMVEAARKYGRIVQTGTQSRSSHGIREGIEWAQAGNLGKPIIARGTCFKPRRSIGKVSGDQAVPDHIDWDLYCGPAPLEPLRRRQLHYDWHWQFVTGNGDLGNQGIHQVDMCRWMLGEKALAPAAASIGGRFGYDDDGDTPNTMAMFLAYDEVPMLFEVRGLPKDKKTQEENWGGGGMDRFRGSAIGATLECEGGYLHIPNYTRSIAYDTDGKEVKRFEGASDHFVNFVDAVRKRDKDLLNGDILEGHISSSLCHQGNISYQVGRELGPDAIRSELGTHKVGSEAFERLAAHLDKNGVDIAGDQVTLGPWLEFDPKAERFTSHEPANAYLSREYRAPFIVPEDV